MSHNGGVGEPSTATLPPATQPEDPAPEPRRRWALTVFGVLLVVMMIFRPQGIWPATAILPFLKSRAKGEPPSPKDGFSAHEAPDANIDLSKEQA